MATAVQISEDVIRLAGHPELVTDARNNDYSPHTDNRRPTIFQFMNSAQRRLELLLPHEGEIQKTTVAISQGDYEFSVSNIRHVDRIDFLDANNTITELLPVTYQWMIDNYGTPFAEVDEGTPAYWARGTINAPGSAANNLFTNMPAANGSGTMTIYGGYYASAFTQNSDETWWSVKQDKILVHCTRGYIELDLKGNRSRAKVFFDEVDQMVQQLNFDEVQEDVGNLPPEEVRMRFW